jgi:aryl-alcohol dehydrogenase-like predicted oxidoreductase
MAMNYRIPGGSGIEVSTYCLGTWMPGSAGNPGHDDRIRIIQVIQRPGWRAVW